MGIIRIFSLPSDFACYFKRMQTDRCDSINIAAFNSLNFCQVFIYGENLNGNFACEIAKELNTNLRICTVFLILLQKTIFSGFLWKNPYRRPRREVNVIQGWSGQKRNSYKLSIVNFEQFCLSYKTIKIAVKENHRLNHLDSDAAEKARITTEMRRET